MRFLTVIATLSMNDGVELASLSAVDDAIFSMNVVLPVRSDAISIFLSELVEDAMDESVAKVLDERSSILFET